MLADYMEVSVLCVGAIERKTRAAMIIISWNVRGSGDTEKRRAIKDLVLSSSYDIILIQESNIAAPSPVFLSSMGGSKLDSWAHLDAISSAVRILMG